MHNITVTSLLFNIILSRPKCHVVLIKHEILGIISQNYLPIPDALFSGINPYILSIGMCTFYLFTIRYDTDTDKMILIRYDTKLIQKFRKTIYSNFKNCIPLTKSLFMS